MLAPVELARVDDYASDCGAVASDPFRGGMDDDVGAVVDGADEVAAGSESVVNLGVLVVKEYNRSCTYYDRYSVLMCNLGDGLKIWDVVFWVSNAFDVNSLCLLINGSSEILSLVSIDELCVYA